MKHTLPPPPCSCETCVSYCQSPGWWTIEEARLANDAGFATTTGKGWEKNVTRILRKYGKQPMQKDC